MAVGNKISDTVYFDKQDAPLSTSSSKKLNKHQAKLSIIPKPSVVHDVKNYMFELRLLIGFRLCKAILPN